MITVGRYKEESCSPAGFSARMRKKVSLWTNDVLGIAVDNQDFQLVLGIEAKIDRTVAGKPIFLEAHSADVGSRLGQLGLKAH